MTFGSKSAANLYQTGQHPRLLCGQDDLIDLRRRVKGGSGKKIFDAVRKRADRAAKASKKDPHTGVVRENLPELALIAAISEDPRLIDCTRRVLLSMPALGSNGVNDRMSIPYSTGGAIGFAYDLMFDHLSDAERRPIAGWLAESCVRGPVGVIRRGNYLRHAGMNIPMVGMISAFLAMLAVDGDPGVPDLTADRKEMVLFLEAALYSALGPEGYPAEDIAYGTGMICFIAWAVEAARRAGIYDAYTQCPRYARFGRAMLHFTQPWGEVTSNTGDYGADFGWRGLLLPILAQQTRDPAVLWLHGTLEYPIACSGWHKVKAYRRLVPEIKLSSGFRVPCEAASLLTLPLLRQPVHPSRTKPPTAYMDPDRGIVSLRSSWKPDATFLVFDGAQRPAGAQGHAHDSGGHFSLSALGEYFAIDTGRYNIEQEHHNVVIVDGTSGHVGDGSWKSTRYHAVLTGYHPHAFVDTASVDSSQMTGCYWARRTIGLVKDPTDAGPPGPSGTPAYVWTAEDVNFADDYRRFHWLLNTHPDGKIKLHETHATLRGAYHGNLLDVHFALPAPAVFPRPHTLWLGEQMVMGGSPREYLSGGRTHRDIDADYRRNTGNPEWGPSWLRPRLVAEVAGYNGRFLSIMLPRKRGEKPAKVERLTTPDNTLAVRITMGKVVDTLIWAYEHCLLEADDISGRGQWCVVRRSAGGGKVLAHAIHRGESLRVAGRRLRV